jgi:hypothetical protein
MTTWDLNQPPPAHLVAQVVGTAADLMEQGWCQGQAWCQVRVDGHLTDAWCASGAISEAVLRGVGGSLWAHGPEAEHLAGHAVWAIFDKIQDGDERPGSLWMWNDDVYREKQEVLDVFREVEKDYLAKGDAA